MSNKASKSPSGEDRAQPEHLREESVEKEEVTTNTTQVQPGNTREGDQENLKNRGFEEDQPGNPVRSTGSTNENQETGTTGEPEKEEQKQ